MSVLLFLTAGFLSYVAYNYFLYPAFLSPLAKIPNAHFSSPSSSLWILWIRFRRRENRTLLACHKRLGPIIRLGPKELSVDCVDGGIRTIYSGGYEKHDWYTNIFDNYGYLPSSLPFLAVQKLSIIVYPTCFRWPMANRIRFASG